MSNTPPPPPPPYTEHEALEAALALCMQRDQHRYRSQWQQAVRNPSPKGWNTLTERIHASQRLRTERQALVPPVSYDPELPISAHRTEILAALAAHPVVIVCGETGSGKSTQLPKLCLESGRGVAGFIGHTQPRRIAARSIARRLSEELGAAHKDTVAWKMRFDDTTTPHTLVKSMTDGVLLAELQHDRFLDAYDTIILDEAHERSLNVDFLLGVLKQILERRDDLKIIVTSATIDPERFQRHFNGAPVVQVSGRNYPVEMRYRPLVQEDGSERELDGAVAEAVRELQDEAPGDVLVFLPTERDIREVGAYLDERRPKGMDVLTLFGRMAARDQDRVFRTGPRPRIVLATNVAETSLTVPGVRYVVDAGTARISRFSVRHKVQRLPIEAVSQASASQRAGRCGRVQDGICIRLYSEEDFLRRDEYTDPEIVRTNLASVILKMKAFALGVPETFPFVDRPPPSRIRAGYQVLFELRALDDEGGLTEIGHALARLPVDPRFGRMAFEAARSDCLPSVLIIVAALSVQDPRERPADARADADRVHARFQDPASDFGGLVRLWREYEKQREALSRRKLDTWCRENYLRPARMREWSDVLVQLRDSFRRSRMAPSDPKPIPYKAEAVHRAILAGLLDHVAERGSKHAYTGTRESQVFLFPNSVLFDTKPRWIVAAERVQTTRLFARTVGPIRREWIEPLAEHLVKRSYSDAHWDERRAYVGAFEQVTLHGLVLVKRRRVHYGPIHAVRAREIFIRHALVHGRYHSRAAFHRHNRALLTQAQDLSARLRRRDVAADTQDLYAFFDQRLPTSVYSGQTLEHWRDTEERDDPRVLYLRWEDAAPGAPSADAILAFPDQLTIDGVTMAVTYRFEPGHPSDGISLAIPRQALTRLGADRLQWLVPGALPDKVAALLRTLPKSIRRTLQPMQERAERCVASLVYGQGDLLEALAVWIQGETGTRVLPRDFAQSSLDPYHVMHLRVVDEQGKTMAHGRSLAGLRRTLAAIDAPEAASLPSEDEVHTSWTFDPLPEVANVEHGGYTVAAYPCLQDLRNGVRVVTLDSRTRALRAHRAGCRRLITLVMRRPLAFALERVKNWKQRESWFRTLGRNDELRDQMMQRIGEHACAFDPLPRDADAFAKGLARGERAITQSAHLIVPLLDEILSLYDQVSHKLMLVPPPGSQAPIDDMIQQIARLVENDFLVSLPFDRLQHMPRYLRGIDTRLQKLGYGALANDLKHLKSIKPHWERYLDIEARNHFENIHDPELDKVRWMIEELRVSVFAQELGTSTSISPARVEAQWKQVRDL